jgi:hypothetical protein
MRRWRWLAVALPLAACGPDGDALEQRAREALERDDYDTLELTAVPGEEGVFDFTGTREGVRCEGTIRVSVDGSRSTAAMQSHCE